MNNTEIKTRQFKQVLSIIEDNGSDKAKLITILQKVQEEYRYLPEEVITYIATALNMPVAEVYGVATFYAHFALEPKGKYVVKVCNGTACHVKGAMNLVHDLFKKLNLSEKNPTSADMLFTVETVSCLGACGLAPVLVINEKVYGQVDSKKLDSVIDEIIEKEGGVK